MKNQNTFIAIIIKHTLWVSLIAVAYLLLMILLTTTHVNASVPVPENFQVENSEENKLGWDTTELEEGAIAWSETESNISGRNYHGVVEFEDKLWVLGGSNSSTGTTLNDVWQSEDGENWTQVTDSADWSPRVGHSVAVFDDKMWVIGGDDGFHTNDVWYSEDGETWTEATSDADWSSRKMHTSLAYDGRIWVIGGTDLVEDTNVYNDVWHSQDGISWSEATGSAAWGARFAHESVVFDESMWVIGGGSNLFEGHNDVWRSDDGANWTEVASDAEWGVRSNHAVTVFDNEMWITGGINPESETADEPYNDVWRSADGESWDMETDQPGWSDKSDHSLINFAGSMLLIGDEDGQVYTSIEDSISGYLVCWSEQQDGCDNSEEVGIDNLQATSSNDSNGWLANLSPFTAVHAQSDRIEYDFSAGAGQWHVKVASLTDSGRQSDFTNTVVLTIPDNDELPDELVAAGPKSFMGSVFGIFSIMLSTIALYYLVVWTRTYFGRGSEI